MVHEFEKLDIDGHDYPTWSIDVKISLIFRGMYEAIIPSAER
jgi:hypothetical protein